MTKLRIYFYLQLQAASGACAKQVVQPNVQYTRFCSIAGGCLQGSACTIMHTARQQIGSVNTHMRMPCLDNVQMHSSA